jgi:hypothetical protein
VLEEGVDGDEIVGTRIQQLKSSKGGGPFLASGHVVGGGRGIGEPEEFALRVRSSAPRAR